MNYPYVIQHASPDGDNRCNNVKITYGVCNSDTIDHTFTSIVADIMYEFASEIYGHNLTITSFDDFCDQYWNLQEIEMIDWHNPFDIKYYDGTKWCVWNVTHHTDNIYKSYSKMRIQSL